jgi:hypothetical protein
MAMSAVDMEEVHQRAGKQQQVGCEAQCVLPVLAKNEECGDHSERGGEQYPSAV